MYIYHRGIRHTIGYTPLVGAHTCGSYIYMTALDRDVYSYKVYEYIDEYILSSYE